VSRPGEPEHPEIPYPFPPSREPPRRTDPVLVPIVGVPEGDPTQRLFDRRRILVSGPLDSRAAQELCAQLMALDGASAQVVEVVLNSPGGAITELSVVLDVVELMRAPVAITCVGTARGTAAILLACGSGRRRAGSHATVSLRCELPEALGGTAAEITRQAEELQRLRDRLRAVVVEATGQPAETIAAELDHGLLHDAVGARDLGIVDEVLAGPDA
jgi:ATP-dependent Clp protease protease subunit